MIMLLKTVDHCSDNKYTLTGNKLNAIFQYIFVIFMCPASAFASVMALPELFGMFLKGLWIVVSMKLKKVTLDSPLPVLVPVCHWHAAVVAMISNQSGSSVWMS